MYAVFETGGKQYRASAGDLLKVEKLDTENGASVTAEVVDAERKDKKILIFKMKRRKTYRLKKGHRQRHSIVKITGINA